MGSGLVTRRRGDQLAVPSVGRGVLKMGAQGASSSPELCALRASHGLRWQLPPFCTRSGQVVHGLRAPCPLRGAAAWASHCCQTSCWPSAGTVQRPSGRPCSLPPASACPRAPPVSTRASRSGPCVRGASASPNLPGSSRRCSRHWRPRGVRLQRPTGQSRPPGKLSSRQAVLAIGRFWQAVRRHVGDVPPAWPLANVVVGGSLLAARVDRPRPGTPHLICRSCVP